MKTEYQIVGGIGTAELSRFVTEEIAAGWQPLGGIAVEPESVQPNGVRCSVFLQAMIRTEQPKRTTHPLSTKVGKQ